MTEMEPREVDPNQAGIDHLLRRSMAAPVPELAADFDQRVMRALQRRSRPLDHYRRMLLLGYGLASVIVCAGVMHSQGLGWGPIAATILAPLPLIAVARSAWSTNPHRRVASKKLEDGPASGQ